MGSSPLARGALSCGTGGKASRGLIPARAGSTRRRLCACRARPAHPRSRGEHLFDITMLDIPQGSSPLARGARRSHRGRPAHVGLIPARAGSTLESSHRRRRTRAHPRSRGEHVKTDSAGNINMGSSPLARGARSSREIVISHAGLIPARAGSTMSLRKSSAVNGAHPRSRGEHVWHSPRRGYRGGSSPLARGAPTHTSPPLGTPGLIPARAGSTSDHGWIDTYCRAHPRSRGEHRRAPFSSLSLRGSSPLARGALHAGAEGMVKVGLIPARAGSTQSLCGRGRPQCGSSPLARGAHCMTCSFESQYRC